MAHQEETDRLGPVAQCLVQYRVQFLDTPRAAEVPALLASLPSPLDRLKRAKIDKKQLFEWQPKELVGILGGGALVEDAKIPAPKFPHALAISPDGRYVVSGGPKGLLRNWDLTTHAEHKVFGHSKLISRLAFAPDGRSFATASFDGSSKLWDIEKFSLLATLDKQDRPLASGRTRNVTSVAFSPDGKVLATGGGDGTLRFWDAATGALTKSMDAPVANVSALAFSSNGKQLFWAGDAGQVRWTATAANAVDKAALFQTRHGFVKTLALSPDGRTIAFNDGRDGVLTLCSWDGSALKESATAHQHTGLIHGVTFSPDGKTLVSVSEDKFVKVWNVAARFGWCIPGSCAGRSRGLRMPRTAATSSPRMAMGWFTSFGRQ